MSLTDVALGGPHVAAHNAERHAINDLQTAVAALHNLSNSDVNGLIAAYPHITEADVLSLIAANPSLSEDDVNTLIAAYPFLTQDDVNIRGDLRWAPHDPVIFQPRREPHRRLRRHPHPPKVEVVNVSTIASPLLWRAASALGVIRDPVDSAFDFGVRDGQMDTIRNVIPTAGWPNSYPYNAAVIPSLVKGAPLSVYYSSAFFRVGFVTDEPVLEIVALIGLSGSDWQIYQDGQPIFDTPVAGNAASTNTIIRLTNPDRQMRHYELDGGLYFIGVTIPSTGQLYKPPKQTGPKVAWVGDSVAQGVGADVLQTGFAYTVGHRIGWDRVEYHTAGGSGFAAAGAIGTFAERIAYINDDIDILITEGGYNDTTPDPDVWAGLVVDYYTLVRSLIPNAKLIHVGPWGHTRSGKGATYSARMASLKTAFAANPGLVDYLVDTVSLGFYWFTGTGYQGATTGDGNSDFFLWTDAVHFSQAGHDYVSVRLANELSMYFYNVLPTDRAVLDSRRTLVDTTANLAAASIAPAEGQLVYDRNTGKLRIGDGTTLPALLQLLNPQRWRSRISANGPAVASSGALSTFAYQGPAYATTLNTGGNGSYVTYRGDIGPGTWTARTWYSKHPNCGQIKLEYSLDEGANWVTAQASVEMYAAVAAYQQSIDNTGIVVGAGINTILWRWTSIGKNASSTNYYIVAGEVDLTRTA